MIERVWRSLSFRLLAIFLVMGGLFAYGAVLGIRWVYATDQVRELVSGHLALHIDYVKTDIGEPPKIENARAITKKVPVDIRITGPGLDWASDPNFPALAEIPFGTGDTMPGAETFLAGLEDVQYARFGGHGFLKIDQGNYAIIVSSPKIRDKVVNRQLTPVIIGFGLFLVLLTYLAVRWLFKPISAIRRGAAQIGRGNFEHRIVDVRRDQLGDLADDINKMAGDVQGMLDAKRQMLLGISHELRSPLSRMKLALELADDPQGLEGFAADIAEMQTIIVTLLEAERLNTRHAALQISRVSVKNLLTNFIETYFSRETARISISAPDDLQVDADEARLTLLLKNLVSNALRYSTTDDGAVEIQIDSNDRIWQIRVSDHGPGIPADQVEFIGEPFYRGDPSRTRNTGGSGLGLYLSRLVAVAHGGTLELDQSYTGGARFVVTLPRTLPV